MAEAEESPPSIPGSKHEGGPNSAQDDSTSSVPLLSPRMDDISEIDSVSKELQQSVIQSGVFFGSETDFPRGHEALQSEPKNTSKAEAKIPALSRRCEPNGENILEPLATNETSGQFQIILDDDEDEDINTKSIGDNITTKPRESSHIRQATAPAHLSLAAVASFDKTPDRSPNNTPPTSPRSSPARVFFGRFALSPKSPLKKGEDSAEFKKDESTSSPRRHLSNSDDFSIKSPLAGPFRAIRARAMAAYKASNNQEATNGREELMNEDGSSSDDDSLDEEGYVSTDDESDAFEDILDDHNIVEDFTDIAPMPNSFLGLRPDLCAFLDRDLADNIGEQNISTFAEEHHLFAKGLMQLLAERDAVGVEDDIHDSSNVIMMGPLKKKSKRGQWSVKYVEIRRGNLSYFADDANNGGGGHRKTIHIRKRTCWCAAVSDMTTNAGDYVFELMVDGRPRIQFMAVSEEERQGWIRAVGQAMIGDMEGSQQDTPIDLSMHQPAIDSYRSVQGALKQVLSRSDYLVAVDSLLYRKTASSALRLPMSWVRDEIIETQEKQLDDDSPDVRVKTMIAENWKYLSNTSVDINGNLIEENTSYSANRLIGTLARCIMEYDHVEVSEEGTIAMKLHGQEPSIGISEVDAVSYARSILVSAVRSEKHGHIAESVRHLVQNDLVSRVELVISEPLRIDVSFATEDDVERERKPYDISGWLLTRPKKARVWKNRYFVVSEGVLSFFAEAEPRPYRLRGQMVLSECTMEVLEGNVLLIQNERVQRCLQFQDRGQLLRWRNVLERAANSSGVRPQKSRKGTKGRVQGPNPLKSATDTGVKVGKRAVRAMKGAPKAGLKKARGMLANIRQRGQTISDDDRRNTTEAMVRMSTRGLSCVEKRDPKVHVITEFNKTFRVMPLPSKEGDDPLL